MSFQTRILFLDNDKKIKESRSAWFKSSYHGMGWPDNIFRSRPIPYSLARYWIEEKNQSAVKKKLPLNCVARRHLLTVQMQHTIGRQDIISLKYSAGDDTMTVHSSSVAELGRAHLAAIQIIGTAWWSGEQWRGHAASRSWVGARRDEGRDRIVCDYYSPIYPSKNPSDEYSLPWHLRPGHFVAAKHRVDPNDARPLSSP